MDTLMIGDKVEVRRIMAGCAPGHGEVMTGWVDGFEVVSLEGSNVMVRHTLGVFEGVVSRVDQKDVRRV